MTKAEEQQESLEQEALAARRAYLKALAAWERAHHEATCPRCRSPAMSTEDYEIACETAEAQKEVCRMRFRDLVDRLGYVPEDRDAALPDEEFAPACAQSAGRRRQ